MYIYSKDYQKLPVHTEKSKIHTSFYVMENGHKITLAYYYQNSSGKYYAVIVNLKEDLSHLTFIPKEEIFRSASACEYFIQENLLTVSMNYFCDRFKSQKDIYDYLIKNDVKGIPGNCVECIVAKLLGQWYSPISNNCSLDFYPNVYINNQEIRKFANDFDARKYPELELSSF